MTRGDAPKSEYYIMIALSASDINLSFGTDVILQDISFAINDGDRLGIIGVNGAGKTSLFKVITGEYTPDSGAVFVQKGHTVGILEQNPDLSALPGQISCLEYMYTAYPTLLALEREIARTEEELTRAKGDEIMTLTARLNEQNLRFAAEGGLEFRSRCRGMLMRLGFDEGLTEKYHQRIAHYIDCEAHRDVMMEIFKTYNHTNEKD